MADSHPKSKSSGSATRTLTLTPNYGEMIKPAELIDIDGAAKLTLAARRTYNILVAHAFGPGMGKKGTEFSIELSKLRGTHQGNDRLEDSIVALMRTVVSVRLTNGRTRRVQLLGGNDMEDSDRRRGILTYTFDPRLIPLLRESTVFGKLELEVMRAFSTKYALALYEALARRVRLTNVFSEIFPLAELREVLGVPDGKLATYGNLKLKAIEPAVTEINALASFGCQADPIKQGRSVTAVRIFWWLKDVSELKVAFAEVRRSRVGRKARINGSAETVASDPTEPLL